jgi:hypothetical protein
MDSILYGVLNSVTRAAFIVAMAFSKYQVDELSSTGGRWGDNKFLSCGVTSPQMSLTP